MAPRPHRISFSPPFLPALGPKSQAKFHRRLSCLMSAVAQHIQSIIDFHLLVKLHRKLLEYVSLGHSQSASAAPAF